MKARFLHVADCHLGYKQYNRSERFDDFARAFLAIVDVAIAENVDFVILAGDLFQKRAIDALTLDQATRILGRLKDAGIPCIAIEGNHELSYYDEFLGWVQFLARQELLILLSPRFEDGTPILTPYKRYSGAYIDPVPGLRVYGLKYMGASTARMFAAYAEALDAAQSEASASDIEYTIFVAHTGVEGVLSSDSGGLSHRQLAVLKPHVNYLALGHIHKPFDIDGWVYNPGSPETCSLTEAAWPERGYYLVEVDTEADFGSESDTMMEHADKDSEDGDDPQADRPQRHLATLHSNPRRPFLRYEIKVDHHTSPEALFEYAEEFLIRKARDIGSGEESSVATDEAPVVELMLSGVLPFERSDLDLRALEEVLHQHFHPLYAVVRNATRIPNREITIDEKLTRAELEKQVLSALFTEDARYSDENEEWAQLAIALKNQAVGGGDAETMLKTLAEFLDE